MAGRRKESLTAKAKENKVELEEPATPRKRAAAARKKESPSENQETELNEFVGQEIVLSETEEEKDPETENNSNAAEEELAQEDSQSNSLDGSNDRPNDNESEEETVSTRKAAKTRKAPADSEPKPVKKKASAAAAKTKAEKSKEIPTQDAQENAVLEYLRRINEPVNAVEIGLNFQTGPYAMSSLAARKIVLQLVSKGLITEKKAGASTIYVPVHTEEDNNVETEELDMKIKEKEEENTEIKKEVEELKNKKNELNKYPSDQKLLLELEDLEIEISIKEERIAEFKKMNKSIDPKEKEKMLKDLDKKIKLQKKIRTAFKHIIGDICEGMGTKPSALMEQLGITEPTN
ncbi:hypothetical protein NEMIN01_0605 [Nematocida minor]|uniref:uncharacterized protein n=1 Tax=Nematocida minor TaxID=1912983 RepID=UPI00221F768C|nr:uncharacterized protein NEMIN01_0605 [Nematocida minor]KAI5189652.1 hypothetical protein NEMIN01_0605 [Nematocida minor]